MSRPVDDASGDDRGAPAGETPRICRVAENGNVDEMRSLLDSDAALIDSADDSQRTALIWAADRGNAELVALLLDRGADLNLQDCDGQTALHYAAICGHADVAKALLADARCDRSITDNDGSVPIEYVDEDDEELRDGESLWLLLPHLYSHRDFFT